MGTGCGGVAADASIVPGSAAAVTEVVARDEPGRGPVPTGAKWPGPERALKAEGKLNVRQSCALNV